MCDYHQPPDVALRPTPVPLSTHTPLIHHSFIYCPTPRMTSYNIRTFSGMPTDVDTQIRQNKLFSNIRSVMRGVDVLLLQETKSPPDAVYSEFRAEWFAFKNPFTELVDGVLYHRQKAGTTILVRNLVFCA